MCPAGGIGKDPMVLSLSTNYSSSSSLKHRIFVGFNPNKAIFQHAMKNFVELFSSAIFREQSDIQSANEDILRAANIVHPLTLPRNRSDR